jgi:hypothetical protein
MGIGRRGKSHDDLRYGIASDAKGLQESSGGADTGSSKAGC